MNTQITINENDTVKDMPMDFLSADEKDALGEIGNICMGTSATTLSMLLGKRVTITTPRVSVCRGNDYLDDYEKPVVSIEVSYIKGINGVNTFLIKKDDAILITKLLVGDIQQSAAELEEIYLSAISEVMNQMVGSSSTAIANALQVNVNISPPQIKELTAEEKISKRLSDDVSIVISFKMDIEGLLSSNIMQILPLNFGKKLARSLFGDKSTSENLIVSERNEKKTNMGNTNLFTGVSKQNIDKRDVEIKDVKFQSFDNSRSSDHSGTGNNIDLIIDVPLQVTVVLGKSKKSIKDILDFGMGSVIVLDRLAGDMVDVLVNGKVFARGEVVVINDNYGVRITELSASSQFKQQN